MLKVATEKNSRRLELEDDDETAFAAIINLGCGIPVKVTQGIKELVHIGRIADKYGMDEVCNAVEDEVLMSLTLDTCGELLMEAGTAGLARVERQSRSMALDRFESFAGTEGFLSLSEPVFGSLLSDEGLHASAEEAVFAALVRWMMAPMHTEPEEERGDRIIIRGEGLLQHIRFGLMGRDYLTGPARELLPGCARLDELVRGALSAQEGSKGNVTPRGARDIDWDAYLGEDGKGGGARKDVLAEGAEQVICVAVVGQRVVCGLWNGEVQVWDRATRTEERRLAVNSRMVTAVAGWDRWVVSGSGDGQILVWDAATGRCEASLLGHRGGVGALVVCGGWLLSGSDDGTVRAWGLAGAPCYWACERSLEALPSGSVCSLVAWGLCAVGGWKDGSIRVWDVRTGAVERTLEGHRRAVLSMGVAGSTLVSGSDDRTVRAWSLETGECTATATAGHGAGANIERVRCLLVRGGQVIGGTERGRVLVWDRTTLALSRTLEFGGSPAVRKLVEPETEDGCVLACVGREVLVWNSSR